MDFIKRICVMTKKRIISTPMTSIFLMVGLMLSMLTISVCVSVVSELITAQAEKEKWQPPNGNQYVLTWNDEKEFPGFAEIFHGIRQDTGVILNGLTVHVDESEVNTFAAMSCEWFMSDGGWHYPLAEGRYYTADEIAAGEKVALIGKAYKEYVYKENGKEYIDIENEQYEVLGVVGLGEQASLWDSRVFMPATSLPNKVKQQIFSGGPVNFVIYNYGGNLLLDENQISSNAFYLFQESEVTYIGQLETEDTVSALATSGDMIFIIAIVGYFVSLVYAINIVVFWMEKRKKEIAVRKALGYKNRDIVGLLMAEMIGLSAISSLVAVVVQGVMKMFMNSIGGYTLQIYVSNIVVGLAMVLLTSVITSLMPVRKILKIQPVEAIKR